MSKIFVVMDSTDSWSGEVQLHGAIRSMKEAVDSLSEKVPAALLGLYMKDGDEENISKMKEVEIANRLSVLLGKGFTDVSGNDIEDMARHIYGCGFRDYWDNTYAVTIQEVELKD